MKYLEFDDVLYIKGKAKAASNDDCLVKTKLVVTLLYVLNSQMTLDTEQGVAILTKAIATCIDEIKCYKGKCTC